MGTERRTDVETDSLDTAIPLSKTEMPEYPSLPVDLPRKAQSARPLYVRLLNRCRTENEVNRLHISLENRMTPAELSSICGSTPRAIHKLMAGMVRVRERLGQPPPTSRRHSWKAKMMQRAAYSGKQAPEPYFRYPLGPNIVAYSNPAVPPQGKTLVIGFRCSGQRLQLPVPTFLQHLPADRFDLLLLMDPMRRAYVEGLPGIPGGFPGLIDAVDRIVDRAAYAAVVSYGGSAGGLPALILAAKLGLDKGVSVGGIGRDRPTSPGAPLMPLLDELAPEAKRSNLLLIYGAERSLDRKAAASLTSIAPMELLAVKDAKRSVGHNPLLVLLQSGKLEAFLERALDPGVKGFFGGDQASAGIFHV